MTESAWPRRNERWLVTESGQWLAFEPMWLLNWMHTAAHQAGDWDPFAVQELAASVWNLLQQDWPPRTPLTVTELQQRVANLVRALGRPRWAESLGRMPVSVGKLIKTPPGTAKPCDSAGRVIVGEATSGYDWRDWRRLAEAKLAEEMLTHFLPEPIAELHRQGCLVWHGIDHPWELFAARVRWLPEAERTSVFSETAVPVCRNPPGPVSATFSPNDAVGWMLDTRPGIFEHFESLRCWVGRQAWIFGPEFELAQARIRIGEIPVLVRELILSARYTGLKLVLYCNRTGEDILGREDLSLFREKSAGDWQHHLVSVRTALLEALIAWLGRDDVELVWDTASPGVGLEDWRGWRQFLLAMSSGKLNLAWNHRSASQTMQTEPGAILTVVGLHAARLAEQYEIGEPELLVRRLTSLAQLVAWGIQQWRERLRDRLCRLGPPFLTQCAPAAVYITGLEQLSAAWFTTALAGWQWMRDVLICVRNTLRANSQDTSAGILLVAPSRFWTVRNTAVGSDTQTSSEDFWRVTSEDDLARLRAWWRICARCYDALEVTWLVPAAALRSFQDFQTALRPWRRLHGLRRLRLLPDTSEQSELFLA
jgi:hypothetical protein